MYITIRDVGETMSSLGSPEEIGAKASVSRAPSSGFFGSIRNAIIGTTIPESQSKPQDSQVAQSVDTDDLIEEIESDLNQLKSDKHLVDTSDTLDVHNKNEDDSSSDGTPENSFAGGGEENVEEGVTQTISAITE